MGIQHSSPGNMVCATRRSVSNEIFPLGWIDYQTLQGGFQIILVSPDLVSLAEETRGDVFIEESFGLSKQTEPYSLPVRFPERSDSLIVIL
nr:unnamed protein product [Spirometra erinaceieuropaei]